MSAGAGGKGTLGLRRPAAWFALGRTIYEDVLEQLKARIAALGSQALLAKEVGVSYQLLNDVLHRRSQHLGPKLLAGLGLREVVLYAPLIGNPLHPSATLATMTSVDEPRGEGVHGAVGSEDPALGAAGDTAGGG